MQKQFQPIPPQIAPALSSRPVRRRRRCRTCGSDRGKGSSVMCNVHMLIPRPHPNLLIMHKIDRPTVIEALTPPFVHTHAPQLLPLLKFCVVGSRLLASWHGCARVPQRYVLGVRLQRRFLCLSLISPLQVMELRDDDGRQDRSGNSGEPQQQQPPPARPRRRRSCGLHAARPMDSHSGGASRWSGSMWCWP